MRRKIRKQQDIGFKLRLNFSSRVANFLRKFNQKKSNSILKSLNYDMKTLKNHLEKQFESWMTWKNWGKYDIKTWNNNDNSTWTWQIDHIIPCSDLPYSSIEDENFKKCWSLENLRPYSAKLNVIEGSNRVRHKK